MEMLHLFNQLRNFSGVIGEMAYECFHIFHRELKCPGMAFRKQLRWDFPSLDIQSCSTLEHEFYFVTNSVDVFSRPDHCSLMNLRKMIIIQIIKSKGFEDEEPFLQIIYRLNKIRTFFIYYKMLKIHDILLNLEVYDKIKILEKEAIQELFKKMNF